MKATTIPAFAAALLAVADAQTSNPYLTYSALCPAATVAASSKAVHSCEQFYYASIMEQRKDCQPVPVASCECEWFNSWVSTCMANICPTAGIASIVSEQGPVYCSATGTSTGTAAATATSAGTGSTPGATTAASPAGTTTAKSGSAGGVGMVPLVGGVAAGLVGLVAIVL